MTGKAGGEYVYEALVDAGIEHLIGLPGTQTLPLDRIVVDREGMEYVMARHETAIPHIAWGYYEAGGTPAATVTVPGPGDTNAMHGLKNALEDCVPIVHVSADADPEHRGKGPIHEIEPDTFDNVVKANVNVERARDLPEALSRGIETALTEPYGPVRLGVPSGILADEFEAAPASVSPERVEYDNGAAYDRAAEALAGAERPAIYVGGGARRSEGGSRVVADLADALSAPVLATYKGKGVLPEDDDRFLGVSGGFLPASARRVMDRADVVLSLGNDLDGPSTDYWELPLGETLIQVNVDPADVGVSYDVDVPIVGDVAAAGDRILSGISGVGGAGGGWDGAAVASAAREEYREVLDGEGLFSGGAPANSPELITAVREATPREAVVTADVGGFRLWALELFDAYAPERFVAAGSWAGMGVGLPAAVGAAAARPDRPVLCLTGDGGLMMCIHELHTAVEYGLDVTVVVSNNADYAVISQSPKIDSDREFEWGTPDFERIGEGFGCRATAVETAADAADAVAEAIGRPGPDVIDVRVDPDEPSAAEVAEFGSTVDPS